MKNNRSIMFLFFLSGLTLFITTCTKDEDSEKVRKEAITNKLNDEISSDTLESLVTWMQGMGTRFALSDKHRDVALKIKKRFIMMGYADARIDSFMINKLYGNVNYQQWQYNVVATLEGSTNPDSVCILGGHYDNMLKSGTGDPFTSGYGANDNASGVAAGLEIARVMKKNNYSPRNTIKFIAFGAEELGLLGSYDFSGKSKLNSEKIKMMLNNDMIAYEPTSDKTNWYVDIMDYDNSHNLRYKAEDITRKYTVLNHVNVNTYNKQSDSYPYSVNGFMALFFFANASDPNYHTPNDIVDNCNFEYCREIAKISCALLVDNN
ncbi:MAG: M20/M25/M40 family metallo-hydrolase [Bacteroidia bacterium]|nr:M20/M25/M40 family metallo-hydrolase [Bacteroidia bacterium]